ncbi:MAG: helix-turn-helix transcriptional regulator [Planctomycetota bacterium]
MAKKKTRKAGKTTASKAAGAAKATKAAGQRPGRRRAEWKHTNFAAIEGWRKQHKLPKYRMAELLGISNGTYHNWARGRAVPSLATQRKIKSVLSGAPTAGASEAAAAGAPAAAGVGSPIRGDALRAATEIVNTYLQTHPGKLSPDRFTQLIRDVLVAVS